MTEIFDYLKKIGPSGWLKGFLYGLLIAAVYYSALQWLLLHDWVMEDYSHCPLIPFVVLYFIWEKRHALSAAPARPSWVGLIPFTFGIALFWLGELGGEFFTMYISLYLVIVGLCWLHMGSKKMKIIWFPLVLMLTMFPFPGFINVRLSFYLKLISSKLGVGILHLFDISAYRSGNIIDLGFTQLQVVDACSGLRYLIPLMVLALILAYWFQARFWKKAVLFVSSIPLAIVVNSGRIALTGILYGAWGPSVAEGFFHGFSGWLIFVFTLGILLVEMWALSKVQSSKFKVQNKGNPEVDSSGVTAHDRSNGDLLPNPGFRLFQQPPQFLVAIGLLVLTFAFSYGIEFREKVPIVKPLSGFPLQMGNWNGRADAMDQYYIDTLDLSDYVIVNYTNPENQTVNFYVAYYESQRKGESIHSPETCLAGGGWVFKKVGRKQIVLSQNQYRAMTVNRAFMQKSGHRQLVYFWFPQRGRILTDAYQLKLYTFWDALTKQRTDGALVRLVTSVYESEELADAEARLEGFVRQVVPVLDGFLPGSKINVKE